MGSNRQLVNVVLDLENEQGRNEFNVILKKHFEYAVTLEVRKKKDAKHQIKRNANGQLKQAPENKYTLFFENQTAAANFSKKMLKEFNISCRGDNSLSKDIVLIGRRRGIYMRVSECNSLYAGLLQKERQQLKPAEIEVPVADFVPPAAGKRLSGTQLGMFPPKVEPQDIEKTRQFQAFKTAYEQKYKASVSKKHKKMMAQLESGGIKNIDQVIDYARQKPYSLTASVLASFNFVDELTQFIIAYGQDQKKFWVTKDASLDALFKGPECSMDNVRQYVEENPKSRAKGILDKVDKQAERKEGSTLRKT